MKKCIKNMEKTQRPLKWKWCHLGRANKKVQP